jgi:hypothetical protein
MALYWEEDFENNPDFGNNPTSSTGWTDYGLGHTGFSVVTTNPFSAARCLRMLYPNGGFIDRFNGTTNNQFNLRFAIRLDPTWATDASNSKIIYLRCDQSPGGSPNGVLEMVFGQTNLVFACQGAFDRTDTEIIPMNVTLNDSWKLIEFQWIFNTPGQANGSMTCWLNDTIVANYTGRQYRGPTPTSTAYDGSNCGSNNYLNNIRVYIQGGSGPLFLDKLAAGNSRIGTGGGGGGGTGTGLLQGTRSSPPTSTINLSTEGVTDWVHWGAGGNTVVNRKVGTTRISALTTLGGTPTWYNNNPTAYSWSNGTPTTVQAGTTSGVFIGGTGNGFRFTAPADTTQRTLKVYAGAWATAMTLNAALSDGSATAYNDATLVGSPAGAGTNAVWTFTYSAGSANQSLTVTVTANSSSGNVQLHAAALTVQGDTLNAPTITSFTPSNGVVGTTVTITGTNFDPLATNNTVKFNGTTATISSASATSLTVTVPTGATTGTITVTTPGGTATSGSSFTVDSATPPDPPVVSASGGSAFLLLVLP